MVHINLIGSHKPTTYKRYTRIKKGYEQKGSIENKKNIKEEIRGGKWDREEL